MPPTCRHERRSGDGAPTLDARRRCLSGAAAAAFSAIVAVVVVTRVPTTRAVVSYCPDVTAQTKTSAQGETMCRTAGEYGFVARTDKSSGQTLYGDLGATNAQRRYSSATFDDGVVAKYVNYSDYALLVRVTNVSSGIWRSKCCQVCENDCEPSRYVCPLTDVSPNDTCAVDKSQVARCRYDEELVLVRAQLLCAVKVSTAFAVPQQWWNPNGMTLRTSWRDCPYRELAVNGSYLLMATAGTPLVGGAGELVGADIVVHVKRDLPAAYFRGMSLAQPGYAYLLNRTGKYCPSESAIRRLSSISSSSSSSPPSSAIVAIAAIAAAMRLMVLPNSLAMTAA